MDSPKTFRRSSSRTNRAPSPPRRQPKTAAVLLLMGTLGSACTTRERTIQIRASSIRAEIAGVQGHFEAHAETICNERPTAETQIVPPLDKNCSRGCSCTHSPEPGAREHETYNCEKWNAREWKLLNFAGRYIKNASAPSEVYFHHQASWRRTKTGCLLDFTIYGDLDEDGVYSTHTATIETTPKGAIGNWPHESTLWE